MRAKPFGLGILVGRFQTVHTGHREMIETAIALCDTVGILVGSSQESGTLKNPFSYEMRKKMLYKVFGNAIRVYPLPDIGVGNTARWGLYVLENVKKDFGRSPDLLISGRESRRADWLDSEEGRAVAELYIPKTIEISATQMREFCLADDREAWQKCTPHELWPMYETLRDIVTASKNNTETASI